MTRVGLTSDQGAGGVLQEGGVAHQLTEPLVLGQQQLRAAGRGQARHRPQCAGHAQTQLSADGMSRLKHDIMHSYVI